jgi:hypothetical protein
VPSLLGLDGGVARAWGDATGFGALSGVACGELVGDGDRSTGLTCLLDGFDGETILLLSFLSF